MLSADATKQELFYVNTSRGRSEIAVVTSDLEQLRESLGICCARPSATEPAREQAHPLHPEHNIQQTTVAKIELPIPDREISIVHEVGLSPLTGAKYVCRFMLNAGILFWKHLAHFAWHAARGNSPYFDSRVRNSSAIQQHPYPAAWLRASSLALRIFRSQPRSSPILLASLTNRCQRLFWLR